MPKVKTLPPGLTDAIANAKRLTRDLQLLQHDCELALTTDTYDNVAVMRDRAFMIRNQVWTVEKLAETIYDSIKELVDAKTVAERHVRSLTVGGR